MSKFYSLIISRLIVPLFSWEFAKDNYHSEKLQTKEESELESLTWFYFFACSDFGIISLVLPGIYLLTLLFLPHWLLQGIMGRSGFPGPPGPPGISIQGDKVIQANVISVQFLLKLFLK